MCHRTVRQSPALPLSGVFIPFIQGPMTVRAITFFPMPPMRAVWLRFSAGPILPSVLLSCPKQALAFSLYGMDSGVNANILPDLRYIFPNSRNRCVATCDQLGLNTGQFTLLLSQVTYRRSLHGVFRTDCRTQEVVQIPGG